MMELKERTHSLWFHISAHRKALVVQDCTFNSRPSKLPPPLVPDTILLNPWMSYWSRYTPGPSLSQLIIYFRYRPIGLDPLFKSLSSQTIG